MTVQAADICSVFKHYITFFSTIFFVTNTLVFLSAVALHLLPLMFTGLIVYEFKEFAGSRVLYV